MVARAASNSSMVAGCSVMPAASRTASLLKMMRVLVSSGRP
jgi:hypothetical protein